MISEGVKLMKFEIYTVSSVDIKTDEKVETCTAKSFTSRKDAVKECVDYIIERCCMRPDIRYALMHDVNHGQVLAIVSAKSGYDRKVLEKEFEYRPFDARGWCMPHRVEDALSEYLSNEIDLYGSYDISTDYDTEIGSTEWIFEISYNVLETEDLMMKEKYMVNPKE